ncbi:MAG: Uma2 family endonuclease [Gemmataceae bacterium]|nr:Uma2 family endonuclease [Gemmataceae bacterium]
MTAVPKKKLTAQEYLAIERAAEFRSEFYNGEMFAMAGATGEHNRIKENFAVQLGMRLLNGPCESFTTDQRVLVSPTGLYTYPDILVVCGEVEYADGLFDTIVNPRVIVEVLSDSTEAYDRGAKFRQYRQIPTLEEYILIAQKEPAVDQFVRQSNGLWVLTAYAQLSEMFRMSAVPLEIPMADIYRRVKFQTPDANP